MLVRALGLIVLLLLPAAAFFAMVDAGIAHYLALGTLFAFLIGVTSRPIAPFALLIPFAYAAAAITSSFTDGVAALIVAVAAAAGAASSQGYHRGLFGMLAAVLMGSFEPADPELVLARSGAMFAGAAYGLLLVMTVAKRTNAPSLAVHPQTALSYAVLLAVLVLVAWLVARMAGFAHAWWLPLAVAALGEPSLDGSAGKAVWRLAAALAATLLILVLLDAVVVPSVRAVCAIGLLLAILTLGRRRSWVQGFLLTPLLLLFAAHDPVEPDATYLQAMLLASVLVFMFTVLGKWMLWTLRPDAGRVHA
jgi:Fusaric acid resistance protein-like